MLNLEYRDTDRHLILPVLSRISNAYQDYSNRDRTRELKDGVKYLEEQIIGLKSKANMSMRTAHNFGLNNGLSVKDGLGAHSGTTGFTSTSSIPSGSIETIQSLSKQGKFIRAANNRAQNGGENSIYIAPH